MGKPCSHGMCLGFDGCRFDEYGNLTETCGVCTLVRSVIGWARMTEARCPQHGGLPHRGGHRPMTTLRHHGAYLTIHAAPKVARTVEIRTDLHVDLSADGRVVGVENVAGPVTAADLASVLFALPLEEGHRWHLSS